MHGAYEEREEKNLSPKTKLSPAVVTHPLLHRRGRWLPPRLQFFSLALAPLPCLLAKAAAGQRTG
jgi:hypothetical protein